MTEAVNIVLKAVPSKTTMPILECVVIEAAGDQIKLTTNDMQLGIETRFPAQVEEDGIILVNAKMISDIIRKLPENDVYFEADDNENILLFCGKAKFNLSGKNHEEFPMHVHNYEIQIGLTNHYLYIFQSPYFIPFNSK